MTNTSLINPSMGASKLQSNGPLYSNTVIGTLATDGWAITFGTVRGRLGRPQPTQSSPVHARRMGRTRRSPLIFGRENNF